MLINADLKQIEVIIFAQLCKDPLLIKLLNEGKDLHKFIAGHVLNKPEEEISKEERTDAKTSTFGIIYGNGAKTLAERTNKSQEWAQGFIDAFYNMFPAAKEWHQHIKKQIEATGQLQLFTGLRLIFKKYPAKYDWQNPSKLYYNPPEGKNYPVQHLAGFIQAIFVGQFYRNYAVHKRDKYMMINTVHDSLMLDSKEEYIDEGIEDITKCLDNVGLLVYTKWREKLLVPLKIDISVGERWSDL